MKRSFGRRLHRAVAQAVRQVITEGAASALGEWLLKVAPSVAAIGAALLSYLAVVSGSQTSLVKFAVVILGIVVFGALVAVLLYLFRRAGDDEDNPLPSDLLSNSHLEVHIDIYVWLPPDPRQVDGGSQD